MGAVNHNGKQVNDISTITRQNDALKKWPFGRIITTVYDQYKFTSTYAYINAPDSSETQIL